MQPAQRWGRALNSLSPWRRAIRPCTKQGARYVSSIPKDVPPRRSDSHTKEGPSSLVTKTVRHKYKEEVPRYQKKAPVKLNTLRPSNPRAQSLHNDREIVDPLSLEKTLQAHQRANQESIVIKHVQSNPESSAKIPAFKQKTPTPTSAVHLALEREEVQEGKGQWEDYTGKPRPLSLDWEIIGGISRKLRVPWMQELDKRQASTDAAATRLTEEIRCADVFFSPSQKEWEATNQAVKQLESFILRVDPTHIKLDVIGSRASGLATPLSDLDLNLVVSDKASESAHNDQVRILGKLFKTMRWGDGAKGQFNTAYFAGRARVPIIVGTHISGLEFQIQSASSCYGSLEVVKCLCAELPTMRALFKIIKQMLKMRGLCDGHHGGLTSYPLINMIAVSLKKHAIHADPFDYGQHLIQFLEYWSTIDLYKTGITHIPGNSFTSSTGAAAFSDTETAAKSINLITQDPVGAKPIEFDVRKDLAEIHEGQDNFMMTLHDPANPQNDLGRSAYAIKHIQATFMEVLAQLKKDMERWDGKIRAGESHAPGQGSSLLRALIEGDYSLYNMERKRITTAREFVEFESDPEVDGRLE